MNDKEILKTLHEGNAKTFEIIYNRFYANVFFIAYKYIRSEEDAKDIRSGCFIKLWELKDRIEFDSMAALYGWLRSTTINSCIDYLRKKNTREYKKEEISNQYLLDNQEGIFELSDKEAILVERLLKRVDALSPKFKIVFKMRCFDELKFTEISKQLHTDLSTIKKRYSKALKILRLIKFI